MAKQVAKLTISKPAEDMGIKQGMSNAPASIAPMQLSTASVPSLPAAAAGKGNGKSGVVEHPGGALGRSAAGTCTGATGKRSAVAQLPGEAPSIRHLDA